MSDSMNEASDHIKQVRTLLANGDLANAKTFALEAIRQNIDPDLAWANLSSIYSKQGNRQAAIQCLSKALQANQYLLQAYINLANLYLEDSNSLRAFEVSIKALSICGDSAVLRNTIGTIYHHNGDLKAAFQEYSEAIKLDKMFYTAYYNRATIHVLRKDWVPAISDLTIAHNMKPDNIEYATTLFQALYSNGDYNQCLQLLEECRSIVHDVTQRLWIANCLVQLKEYDAAIDLYLNLLAANSDPNIHFELALCYELVDNIVEAEIHYQKSLQIDTNSLRSLVNYGNFKVRNGDIIQGTLLLKAALEVDSCCPNALFSLARISYDSGDYNTAKNLVRLINTTDNKLNSAVHFLLGNVAFKEHDIAKAIELYKASAGYDSLCAEPWFNMGLVYLKLFSNELAISCFLEALKRDPIYDSANINLAYQYYLKGDFLQAIRYSQRELELAPDCHHIKVFLMSCELTICLWHNYNSYMQWLSQLVLEPPVWLPPHSILIQTDDPGLELATATLFAKHEGLFRLDRIQRPAECSSNQKIKIGFFSNDYYEHATMHLIRSLLHEINPNLFDVILYDYGVYSDHVTESLKNSNLLYRDISLLPTQDVVELANQDQINVAIDLKGYTYGARVNLFCHALAPIHISFLGYPGTSGTDIYDFIIADRVVAPPELHKYFTEKVLWMPSCYQPNDPTRDIGSRFSSRQANCLPDDKFIFCCFNNTRKLSPLQLDAWMSILRQTDSILWLLAPNLLCEENLRREAGLRGVSPDRLYFANMIENSEHLGRHIAADLQLDTFNCNSHTTASDSLFAGLPILTKIGHTFSSRVCASILKSSALNCLVAETTDQYIQKAIYYAENPDELQFLKDYLTSNKYDLDLFDIQKYARSFEKLISDLVSCPQ